MSKVLYHNSNMLSMKPLKLRVMPPKLLGRSHKPAISAEIIVMEYLLPPTNGKPGWITLFDLVTKHPALVDQKSGLIQVQLDAIVLVLKGSKLVHGDLRSNNLMIFCTLATIVEPVQVKAVDMEWQAE
jgi:serine/threonine-protein kinase RIO1